MDAVLHSSARHDWQTPDEILELVRKLGPIALDPCTDPSNPTGAEYWIAEGEYWLPEASTDIDPWEEIVPGADALVYVNPPYGRGIDSWVDECVRAWGADNLQMVLLVPARTDTQWYDTAMGSASAVCEVAGRLRFKGAPHPAPFPSAIFYWGPSPYLFCHVFQERGRVRVLRS